MLISSPFQTSDILSEHICIVQSKPTMLSLDLVLASAAQGGKSVKLHVRIQFSLSLIPQSS